MELGCDIKSNKYLVPTESVLVSKLNPQFPRVWMPDVCEPHAAICSTEFMPLVPLRPSWRSFLFELTQSGVFHSEILMRVTGSTGSRQRVKPKEIAVVPVVVPPTRVVDRFCKRVTQFHRRQSANIRESSYCSALRDALLPKLLSGEIRVRDAEKIAEEGTR